MSPFGIISRNNLNEKKSTLTNDGRFEVYEHGPGDVFSSAGFAEKCVEAVVSAAHRLVGRHLSVRLDTMLQTVQFPARVADLNASLSYMYGYTFTLKKNKHEIKFDVNSIIPRFVSFSIVFGYKCRENEMILRRNGRRCDHR